MIALYVLLVTYCISINYITYIRNSLDSRSSEYHVPLREEFGVYKGAILTATQQRVNKAEVAVSSYLAKEFRDVPNEMQYSRGGIPMLPVNGRLKP